MSVCDFCSVSIKLNFFFSSFTGATNARFDGMVEISINTHTATFMSGVSSTVGNQCCVLQSIVNRL